MAREINRLSARRVATIATPGRHADGGGLYLVVDKVGGAKRWVFLYRFRGKRREMGLGSTNAVPLIAARERAAEARTTIAAGADPIEAKAVPVVIATAPTTFGKVADEFMADHEANWRNAAHRRQWRQTLEQYAPDLWRKPIADVETEDVLSALRPIWQTKAETARRLRGRIERVIDAAIARRLRDDRNPARWKGHLSAVLPRVGKLQRGHHAAMPYAEIPAFYAELCERQAMAASALRLIILTVARSGEVRGLFGQEIDMAALTWTVPSQRMKGNRPHIVPLSAPAAAILAGWLPDKSDELVFPSRANTPLSDMVFNALLRRMGREVVTTHGFRSSFRDWVDAEMDYPADVAESCLSHLVGSETERAYRRGDALEKRRHLMDAWARFVTSAHSAD